MVRASVILAGMMKYRRSNFKVEYETDSQIELSRYRIYGFSSEEQDSEYIRSIGLENLEIPSFECCQRPGLKLESFSR